MRFPLRSRRVRRLALVGVLWTLLLLVAATALLAPATEARPSPYPPRWATHMDRTLGRVVDAISGKRDTVVWCWSVADWELRRDPWPERVRVWKGSWGGYVYGGAVQLSPNECATLKLVASSKQPLREFRHSETFASSALTLAHESIHMAGYSSERKATCWGLQRISRLALELGRTPSEAHYLADVAWKRWYPTARPSYRSPECRDGGRLDLRPNSHVWP